MFNQAFRLAKKELKFHFTAIIFTMLVTIFLALVISMSLHGMILDDSFRPFQRFMIDYVIIGFAPAFGAIYMAKPYLSLKTIKEDPYGKRMALLRTLPISVQVLALSRTIVMIATLLIMSIAFYTTIAIVMNGSLTEIISLSDLILFIFIWLGYTLAVAGMNPFLEYGTNGKILYIVPTVYMVLFVIVLAIFYIVSGHGIVELIFQLIEQIGWPLVVVSSLLGITGCYLWNKLLTSRLQRKDYV